MDNLKILTKLLSLQRVSGLGKTQHNMKAGDQEVLPILGFKESPITSDLVRTLEPGSPTP